MAFFAILEPRVYDNIVIVPRIVTLCYSKNISSSLSRNSHLFTFQKSVQLLFFEERLWFCFTRFQWIAVTAYITIPLGISCQRPKLTVYLYKNISKAIQTCMTQIL